MAEYLIDYENVGVKGFNGIGKLTEKDNVFIFYSENAEHITFGLHRRLTETKANVSYLKVKTGTKNALDFQLSSYLGYLIGQNAGAEAEEEPLYYIVTGDKGFCILEQFWEHKKYVVQIVADLTGASFISEEPEKETQPQPKNPMPNDPDTVEAVRLIGQYKTKQAVHTALQRKYKKNSKKVKEIYAAVKKILKTT